MSARLLLLLPTLAGPLVLSNLAAGREGSVPHFKINTRRPDDVVQVHGNTGRVVFDIHSAFGISQAVIERQADHWPRAVLVRLHLKGLEHFQVGNGRVTLQGAAGIRDGKPEVRLWKDRQEDKPLAPGDPLWITVRVLAGDGKPATALPLQGGFFELELPAALFARDPRSLTVQWIDFYRS